MLNENYNTYKLQKDILECNELEELRQQILQNIPRQIDLWKEKINEIITDNGYTKTELADRCGVSRVTVDKWCKGVVPKNRETFIRIGFAAGYGLEEMNLFLKRYGRYPELYAKSLEDIVCIFVLESEEYAHTYKAYADLVTEVKNNLNLSECVNYQNYSTAEVLNEVQNLSVEHELIAFIEKNTDILSTRYHRFYVYIEAFLQLNCYNEIDDNTQSIHFLANGQQWSSSLRKCVSAIRQKKWYPVRNKMISLGLHLNMDTEQINQMLELAHMEPLYAKNPFEGAIIYALEMAKLEGLIFQDGTCDLCIYVKEVLEKLSLAETDFFLTELP